MHVFRKKSGEDWGTGLLKNGARPVVSELRVTETEVAVKAENGNQMCALQELAASVAAELR